MVKESLKKRIRNNDDADDRKSLPDKESHPFSDDSVLGNKAGLSGKQQMVIAVSGEKTTELIDKKMELEEVVAPIEDQSDGKEERNLSSGISPHSAANPEIIRGIENQLKNAILMARERSAKNSVSSTLNDRQQLKMQDPKRHDFSGKMRLEPKLVLIFASDAIESACFKLLQALLFFPFEVKSRRSILLTSAKPGEVQIVDCDLRRPELRGIFGIDSVSGFSEYLIKGSPLSEGIYKIGTEKMHILPSGSMPKNSVSFLSSIEMQKLLAEWVEKNDERTVILNYAPLSFPAERSSHAGDIDGALVVIDYGATSRDSNNEILDLIGHDRILGCVENTTTGSKFGCGQKYKYGRYIRNVQK